MNEDKKEFNLGRFFIGLLIILIGLVVLARNTGYINFDISLNWDLIWPILIIIAGFSMLNLRGWPGMIIGIIFSLAIVILIFCLLVLFV